MKLTENITYVYDHLMNYEEIRTRLNSYALEHPELCRVSSVGKTREGRDILAIEVTNTLTGSYEDKPALYMEGNIHAGEITGCMCIMYCLDVIFTNLQEEKIREILDKYTIYSIPRVSPDGSEHYLTTPDMVRSVNTLYPYEEDMPGLVPADLDGDGVIRKMRVRSPYGIWKESEADPRVMTKRQPDETEGVFYNVYSEGYINDYDGVNIVSAPGKFGSDFNRNYPIGWKPEHQQRGAGDYPLSHPETRANTDFLLAHSNICAVLDMHTMGGQNLYTPGFKPAKEAERQDIAIYKALGKMAKEENGYPVINVFDEYMPAGSPACFGGFDDFAHFILGVPAFTIECWDLDPRAGVPVQFPPKAVTTDEEQEEHALKYVQWIDKENDGEGITTWTRFDHPQLGEVEIGGIDYKHVVQNPPPKFLPQELEKHTRFMLRLIKTLPQVSFRKVTCERLSGDVFKVDAYLMNTGFLPTYVFKEGLKLKKLKPLKVNISGMSAMLEGKETTEIGQLEGFSGLGGFNSGLGAGTFQTDPLEKKITWIIRAEEGAELKIRVSGGRIGQVETSVTV
ncbi:MAG: zinc carboxypeptidase [Lachnospiraceae bacterium]|nr:zinc carboxypeptidase [Lachnospiraceae bacterium]